MDRPADGGPWAWIVNGQLMLDLLIFLFVSVGVATGYFVITGFRSDESHVRQRLAEEFAKDAPAASSSIFKNLSDVDLEMPSDFDSLLPTASAVAAEAPGLLKRLETVLTQADLRLSTGQVLALAAGTALLLGTASLWLGGLALGLLAATLGAMAPFGWVYLKHKLWQDRYLRQLPAAFELMARVIRAGQSVPQSLQAVGDAFEDPIAGEFDNCQRQQNLGLRPEVSFQEMAQRSGILEMRIFVMAMLIQRQTGGHLSDVLDRLAGLIRARIRLRQHVRTLTAEGRLQGWTLVVLPFVVFGAMMVINRQYAEMLFEHVPLLIATGISMLVGMFWIRRIVNFEV